MGNFLKKILTFLFILVLASFLFNNQTKTEATTSASEIVEIIDKNPEVSEEMTEETINKNEKSNIFVTIIRLISNLFKTIISSLFNVISSIISSFAG